MGAEDPIPTEGELELLFVNNLDLGRLEAHLNRFNPIRTMRMDGMEIRHSAILAWLLDPRETHGLGDRFLRMFLSEAMRGQSLLGSPTALEISQADLRDADVRREWHNIDILILLPRLNWSFVIENKFYSSQHEGQLKKYAEVVRSTFTYSSELLLVRGIFLTLLDEDPQDQSYAPIRYSAICEFMPRILDGSANIIRADVKMFLNHYLEIIMEKTGKSKVHDEMQTLARQLYRSHKRVLDFVMEHGAITEFELAAESVFHKLEYGETAEVEGQRLMFNHRSNEQVSFLPLEWTSALGGEDVHWQGCDNWWAGYPLICWLQLFEVSEAGAGEMRLIAEVGPIENHEFRQGLISRIKVAAEQDGLTSVRFQKGAADAGKRYSKFLKENRVGIQDIQNAEEIDAAMRTLIRKFKPVFSSIEKVLPEFRHYGRTEDEQAGLALSVASP
jgi:hypothetical protein